MTTIKKTLSTTKSESEISNSASVASPEEKKAFLASVRPALITEEVHSGSGKNLSAHTGSRNRSSGSDSSEWKLRHDKGNAALVLHSGRIVLGCGRESKERHCLLCFRR